MRCEGDEHCLSDVRVTPASNKSWNKRHPDGGSQVETKQSGFNYTLKTLTALFRARGSPEGASRQCSSTRLTKMVANSAGLQQFKYTIHQLFPIDKIRNNQRYLLRYQSQERTKRLWLGKH